MMNIKIVNLTTEISTLSDTIKALEEDLKAKDILFMLVKISMINVKYSSLSKYWITVQPNENL